MPQLLSLLHTIYVMGIVLGIMILLHEFGHYAAAKYFGVRVEQFAIGFGKRLIGFRRGETDYRINILPLGGYVKMSGENPMDTRTDDPGEFLNHPRWQRFVIAIAGPAMNVLLAIAILTGVYMVHYEYPASADGPAIVGWVMHNTAAEKAGIQVGDKIVRVDDTANPTWEQVDVKAALSPNQPMHFSIERDGKVFQKDLTPEPFGPNEYGSIGWVPKESSVALTSVEPNMPAQQAGMKVGDQILTANGQPIPALEALVELLTRTKDQALTLVVLRSNSSTQGVGTQSTGAPTNANEDGQKLTFTIKPVLAPSGPSGEMRYRIGIASIPTKVVKLTFPEAFSHSLED
ncbi:MAG: RIP metalloprotease RseP, partial [Terriglobales bacterium]